MMTRKMIGVAGVVAAVVLAPLAVLRPVARAQAEVSTSPRPQAGADVSADVPVANSPRLLAAVRDFRAHLQGWALSHRTLLLRLNDAPSDDRQTLQALYGHLPPSPLYVGDPRLGPVGGGMPRLAEMTPGFSPRHLVRSHDPVARGVQQDFAHYHDLKLASTMGIGRDSFTVWLSGRITRTHDFDVFQGHGKPILLERADTTIVPPFAFLRR